LEHRSVSSLAIVCPPRDPVPWGLGDQAVADTDHESGLRQLELSGLQTKFPAQSDVVRQPTQRLFVGAQRGSGLEHCWSVEHDRASFGASAPASGWSNRSVTRQPRRPRAAVAATTRAIVDRSRAPDKSVPRTVIEPVGSTRSISRAPRPRSASAGCPGSGLRVR
jgi:hypothetical protein